MSISLGSAYGEIQIGTGGAERSVNSLADSMRRVGQSMSLAVTAPLLAVAGAGLKAAMGFETSMNTISVVSNATAAQMEAMSAVAIQLGADTVFSAGEAAEGMLELAKAGLSAQDSMEAISGVLDLAAAANIGVAQAAEISANALNSFKLPASDAGRVADLLAAAANASSVEITDMAFAFQMASAVFSSNEQSIENLSTALAILGNNGIKGSDAGTSLKTMLMRLTAPTDKAADAMAALGIQVYNADGSMRQLPDILSSLEQAMLGTNAVTTTSSNLTEEQTIRMKDLAKTVNSTKRSIANYQAGISGATLTEDKRAKKLDELNGVLAAATREYDALAGVVGTTSTAMMQLTDEQRNEALATIFGSDAIRAATILMSEGSAEFDAMKKSVMEAGAAQKVADARMKGLAGAIEYAKGTIESALISAFLPLTEGLGEMIRKAADLIGKFGDLPEPVRNAALAFAAVMAAVGPLLLALPMIGSVLAALLSPVGLIGLAVAGLAAAWAADFGGIREKTAEAIEGMRPAFDSLRAWLSVEIPAAIKVTSDGMRDEFLKMRIQAALLVVEMEKTFADADIALDWTGIKIPIDEKTNFVLEWAEVWEEIKGVTTRGLINIPAQIGLGFVYVRGAWKYAIGLLSGDWAGAWEGWQLAAGAGLDSILRSVEVWSPEMAARMKKAADTLSLIMEVEWAVLSGIFEQYVLQPLLLGLGETLPVALAGFGLAWKAGWEKAGTNVKTAVDSINTAYESLRIWLHVTLPAALAGFGTAWKVGWEKVGEKLGEIWDTIVGKFEKMQDWLENLLPNAFAALKTFLEGFSLPNPFALWQGILDGIASKIEAVKRALAALTGGGGSADRTGDRSGLNSLVAGGLALLGAGGPEVYDTPGRSRGQETGRMAGATTNNTWSIAIHVPAGATEQDGQRAARGFLSEMRAAGLR